MEFEQAIPLIDVYRKGKAEWKNRAVVARLKYINDKSKIFANASKLQGKTNARKKLFFIRDDLDEQQQEKRSYYRDLLKENKGKEEEERIQLCMTKTGIMANNEVLRPKISPPKVADVLRLPEDELTTIKAVKTCEGKDHLEKGSEFYSFAVKAKNTAEINKAYYKMCIKFADATHISCGFRLTNPNGPYDQGYTDDGEYGQGRNILSALKERETTEMAVFIVRYSGETKLGNRRFEIAKDLTMDAVRNLLLHKSTRNKRLQHAQSHLSNTSDASCLTDGEESLSQNEEEEGVAPLPSESSTHKK